MIPFLTAILWDTAAARALLLTAFATAGAYYMTPNTRPWYERLTPAAATALGVGAASAPSGRTKELEEMIIALEVRLRVLESPK